MSYIIIIGATVAACGLWFAISYRQFGAAEANRSNMRAVQRARFSERKRDESEPEHKPARKARQFGQPKR